MKRDIDLCRQLLLDLEAKGGECATTTLRGNLSSEADQRIRHHLRLLIDAELVKEIEQATTTTIYVRLTHLGHEFLDVCRSEARFNEAKQVVLHRTGGLSLTVIKSVLTQWAVEDSLAPKRRVRRVVRPYHYRREPIADTYYETDIVRDEATSYVDDEFTVVRSRPDYRERYDVRSTTADLNGHGYVTEPVERHSSVSLPIYMV